MTKKFSEAMQAARERYFEAKRNHDAAKQEIQALAHRLSDAGDRLDRSTKTVQDLNARKQTVHADIIAGRADMDAADVLAEELAKAERQVANYAEIHRLTGETLEARRRDMNHEISQKTSHMKEMLFTSAASELREELKPALQKLATCFNASYSGIGLDRNKLIKDFLYDGSWASDGVKAEIMASLEAEYCTP